MVKSNENSAYKKRGRNFLTKGCTRKPSAQFDEAIAEQPKSWKALNSKGICLSENEPLY